MTTQLNTHHENLFSLVSYIDLARKVWRIESSKKNAASQSWDLGAGYEGALELARNGWQQGAERMAVGLDKLPAVQRDPKRSYSVAGSRPSAARFAAGAIRHMIRNKPSEGAKPIVKIAIDVCVSASTDANCMANYGLALARYVQEMEASGRRCEVICGFALKMDDDKRVCHSWTVKKASEPMSFADIAFSIAHPSMFRRLGFALIERTNCKETYGYGQIKKLAASDLDNANYIILHGMNQANQNAKTIESAIEHIRGVINSALGIETELAA